MRVRCSYALEGLGYLVRALCKGICFSFLRLYIGLLYISSSTGPWSLPLPILHRRRARRPSPARPVLLAKVVGERVHVELDWDVHHAYHIALAVVQPVADMLRVPVRVLVVLGWV
jgi:hypothetical protein